jgi:hypothetical protein
MGDLLATTVTISFDVMIGVANVVSARTEMR